MLVNYIKHCLTFGLNSIHSLAHITCTGTFYIMHAYTQYTLVHCACVYECTNAVTYLSRLFNAGCTSMYLASEARFDQPVALQVVLAFCWSQKRPAVSSKSFAISFFHSISFENPQNESMPKRNPSLSLLGGVSGH